MALVVKDRVRETSVTQGTGTFTLAGAVTGYQSFSAIGNGNTTYYTIYLQASNEWEVGIGTYTASGTTLSRDTILASSNGGAVVNFSAGTKDVFVTYPAGRSVYYDTATNVSLNALTVAGAFAANGGATLGDASGDALTINSSAVSTPNGLNFDSNTFVIDATNNRVGIGAASPAKQLDLAANNTGITTGDPLNTLRFTDTDITSAAGQPMGRIEWFSADTDTAGVKAYIQAQATDGSPDADMVFATNHVSGGGTAERMRIQYDGNVGIGTNAPVAQLQVNRVGDGTYASTLAESRSKAGLILNPESTGSSVALNISKAVGGNAIIYQPTNSAATTAYDNIFNPFGGNVGIGTVTPAAKLSVDGSAIFNDSGADVDFRVESDNNTHMLFVDAGNDRVGIGTSTPVSVFDVAGITPVLTIKDTQSKTWVANDTVGDLDFYSTDPSGTGPRTVARIRSFADANGTTAAGALSFWTSAADSAATEKMRLTKEGYVLVGTTASLGTAGVQAAAVATDPFEGYRFGANANGPTVSLYKNRGATVGTNAVVVSGDELGTIAFRGYDGAAYRAGAFITGNVDGTPGASDMPGRLTFSTTADGAATPTERMRIDSTGALIAKPAAGTGAVFNEDGVDADFRVESDTNTHRLFVDGGADTVLMGTTTNTNSSKLVVDGSISETVSSTQYLVASQYDIGTAANEIPLNQYLGNLAYQDASSIAGQVGLSAGTAALPSLVSATDLDTGMWFPAANTLAWSTGGTERARITSGGQVNIGGNFTSTNNTLQVTGNAAIGDTLAGPTDGLYVKGSVGIGTNSPQTQVHISGAGSQTLALERTVAAVSGRFEIISGNNTNLLRAVTAKPLVFEQGTGNPVMRLDSSGNLGLGVEPSAWQSGAKAIQIGARGFINNSADSTAVNVGNNCYYSGTNWIYQQNATASIYQQYSGLHAWLTAASGTAGNTITFTQAMTLHASGGLSLGDTTDPGATNLRVAGQIFAIDASRQLIRMRMDSNIAKLESTYFSGAGGAYQPLAFYTSDTERARIDSGGNWLVGSNTTTPQYGGFAVRPSGNNGSCLVLWNKDQATSSIAAEFRYLGVASGSITYTNTAVAYNTSSDYRLKDNQQPLTGSGDFIDALKPKTWNWKSDGSKGVGFVAHEVQAVSPGSVVGEKDAVDEDGNPIMQAMEYGSAEFIANIIAELQSLRARVAQLEAK